MGGLTVSPEEEARRYRALEEAGGNIQQAAERLGIPRQTLQSWKHKQDGLKLQGTSTLYDAEGNVRLTWEKTSTDKERQEQIMRETVAAVCSEIKPCPRRAAPKTTDKDLLVAYCIGDAHIGLYSWAAETGEDFDLTIAEADLAGAIDRLVDAAPQASEAIVVQLGDFYHLDDTKNMTPRGGNILDVDTRFSKVIGVGIRVMRHVIDKALEKHKLVRVRNVAGNHDPTAAITLTEALKGYYAKEPRVVIEDSPRAFWNFRFGSSLVGITHGHTMKPEKLPGVLAVDAQKDWGECDFKYAWHGHFHNKKVFEDMGVIVESFRTLAGRDAYLTESGYRSGREMQAVVLHKEFGEIERHTAGIKRVRANV